MEKHAIIRDRLKNEDLMQYLDIVEKSERNKEIIRLYYNGMSQAELGLKYSISKTRVSQIIFNFIIHVKKHKTKHA